MKSFLKEVKRLDNIRPSMKELIYEYIKANPCATFLELERHIPNFREENSTKILGREPNVVYWQGLSEEAAEAIQELFFSRKIDMFFGCVAKTPYGHKNPNRDVIF